MQKWEYMGLAHDTMSMVVGGWKTADGQALGDDWRKLSKKEMLKRLGEEGWELVSVAGSYATVFYFKRPKE